MYGNNAIHNEEVRMGAPGEALICQRGHLFFWSDRGVHDWPPAGYIAAQLHGCPCGERAFVGLSHYGKIDDCLASGALVEVGQEEIVTSGGLKRIPNAVNWAGKPIEAFRHPTVTLNKYDVSGLHVPFRVYPSNPDE